MKGLLLGIVLIILIGLGGFFYRNTLEHPAPNGNNNQTVCTLDAKICPDGTGLGRQGPNCAFPACPLPNAEDAAIGLGFVIPNGFVSNPDAIGPDETLRVVLDKQGTTTPPDSLVIRRYPIPEGKKATDAILANTMFETSGNQPQSISEFKKKTIGTHTFYVITVERFEAIIHTEYYLAREKDVLRFEVIERNVFDWTNPKLVLEELPSHKALLSLLGTIQLSQ
ncbi:MAG: hypothetical protein ABA06_02520 [Parcubacteria bacterium C7867-001]|nr:MAG: hypothetical protein ABA06_02520 [Parcubacteria bacterium C7867-001]